MRFWLPLNFGSFENTMVGTFVAMLLGAYLRRRMAAYPGTGTLSVVLPAFAVAYWIVILGFFFLRFDYSRFQFASSFALAVLWFGAVSLIETKVRARPLPAAAVRAGAQSAGAAGG